MKQVIQAIEDWKLRIEPHALHQWLVAENDGIAPEEKLWFSLYFTNFIMYFRELNLYHVGYREHSGENQYCDALTRHAGEDMTHSKLFMRDFRTLGWDKHLAWHPSEVFHWLFTHPVNEQLRRRTVTIAKLYIESQDPLVRYAVVEAIEACGNALFRHTAKLTERHKAGTGKDLVYFGTFHLARETGHAVDAGDEKLFEELALSPEQRAQAIQRAVRAFELIDEQNTDMLLLAQETIAKGGFSCRRQGPMMVEVLPSSGEPQTVNENTWPNVYDFHFWPRNPHPTQRPLVGSLLGALHALRETGMAAFLSVTDPAEMLAWLRLSLMYFATDCVGTPTFYRYMVTYPEPSNAQERSINRMAQRLGRRSHLLYIDWNSLAIDDKLNWPVSRTLEFIYLDRATETHRDLRAVITHHIDVTNDPLLRYWTLVTLKTITNAHSEAYVTLAKRAERQLRIALPYMAGRECLPLMVESDPEADTVQFETLPISPETVDAVQSIISDIFRATMARNDRMFASIRNWEYPEVAPNAEPLSRYLVRRDASALVRMTQSLQHFRARGSEYVGRGEAGLAATFPHSSAREQTTARIAVEHDR